MIRLTRSASLEQSYSWSFDVRDRYAVKGMGLKSAIAWLLRNLADWMDYRESMAIQIDADPRLTREEEIQIVNRGLQHSRTLLIELLEEKSIDRAMERSMPGLYQEEGKQ